MRTLTIILGCCILTGTFCYFLAKRQSESEIIAVKDRYNLELEEAIASYIRALSFTANTPIAHSLLDNNPKRLIKSLESLRSAPFIVRACIYTPERKLFSYLKRESAIEGCESEQPIKANFIPHDGIRRIFNNVLSPVTTQGFPLGTLIVDYDLKVMISDDVILSGLKN